MLLWLNRRASTCTPLNNLPGAESVQTSVCTDSAPVPLTQCATNGPDPCSACVLGLDCRQGSGTAVIPSIEVVLLTLIVLLCYTACTPIAHGRHHPTLLAHSSPQAARLFSPDKAELPLQFFLRFPERSVERRQPLSPPQLHELSHEPRLLRVISNRANGPVKKQPRLSPWVSMLNKPRSLVSQAL